MLPADPFLRVAPAAQLDRRERVRYVQEVAAALLDGRQPDRAAALFVASALGAWLAEGRRLGDLEKHYLRTCGDAGSHTTAQAIAAELERERSTPPR